jgi:type IV secretory pathway TraG/TraD family ATPase VirD4
MDRRYATEHFLAVGASGCGKTTLINNLLETVCQYPPKAIIYDPKQEIVPLLYRTFKESKESIDAGGNTVRILHPLDTRCSAWDMARDIDGPVSARQLASILVQDTDTGRPTESFFTDATRDLLTGVILSFVECVPNAQKWRFRDVLLAMMYEPYLRFILDFPTMRDGRPLPTLTRLRMSYLDTEDKRTTGNIRASINTKLCVYEPIAAMWDAAMEQCETKCFSLDAWVNGRRPELLVLGNDESARVSIDAINQALFKRATEYILARQELSPEDRKLGLNQIWVFLDEVREAGKLDGLSRLMTKGRSKGACVVLGFQDIDGLRDVYGEDVANEIVAQCNNIAVMRLNSPETAQWASELFGRRKLRSSNESASFGQETPQFSGGTTEQELPYVFSADFMYLGTPLTDRAVTGYLKSPTANPETDPGSIRFKVDDSVLPHKPPPRGEGYLSPYIPSPPSSHYLMPWTEKDWVRLGFPGPFRDLLSEAKEAEKRSAPAAKKGAAKADTASSASSKAGEPKAFNVVKAMLNKAKGKET